MTIAPTNALALVVFSTLENDGSVSVEKMAVLSLLVGVFQVAFGMFRLGNLTRFVSNAVMTGFITGAGLLIILGQLVHVSGYDPQPIAWWPEQLSSSLPRFFDWLVHLPQSQPHTLIIGIAAIVIIARLHHTRLKNVATLVAIFVTTVFILIAGWSDVSIVAHVPQGLPSPVLPKIDFAGGLITDALALAVLALVQSAALTHAVREPDGSVANTNQDFVAQGLANLAGSLFQCLPVGGSLSRTAVNINAGARTRLANLIAGLSIGLVLLILGPAVEYIALAALAGHLIVAAVSLIRPKEIKLVWKVNPMARAVMVVTLIATLTLPLEYSIYGGVILSLVLYLYSSSQSLVVEQIIPLGGGRFRAAPLPNQLPQNDAIILNVRGSLYFAAMRRLESLLPMPLPQQSTIVILRLRESHHLASTGLHLLLQYQGQLRKSGGDLLLTGLSEENWQILQQTSMVADFGADNLYRSDETYFGTTEKAYCAALEYVIGSEDTKQPKDENASIQS